ncbi:hypothetical protein [Rhodopila sp.]|uniref:hypothetical protein n=1 Tax=Rhodopila sp. TaxID=2480087 RepID=UPI003D0EF15C
MSNSADDDKAAAEEQQPQQRQAQQQQVREQAGQEQRAQGQQAQDQQPERVHEDHDAHLEDEEKVLAGRHDVNFPALLTKDVPGG